jgi:hypothetical protein
LLCRVALCLLTYLHVYQTTRYHIPEDHISNVLQNHVAVKRYIVYEVDKIGAGVAQSLWSIDYGLDSRGIGVKSPTRVRDLLFPVAPQTDSGTQPDSHSMSTEGDFAGHAEVKNAWIYASILPFIFMA